MEIKLKVGDTVQITENLNQLNMFMYEFAGKTATVTQVNSGTAGGQICKLDIDNGHWSWYYNDKLDHITKI